MNPNHRRVKSEVKMRRQNRSCDQCRRAKRACNAPSLWDIHHRPKKHRSGADASRASASDKSPTELDDANIVPCSYCLRTRKLCTFNWARSRFQSNTASAGGPPVQANRHDGPSSEVPLTMQPKPGPPEPQFVQGADFIVPDLPQTPISTTIRPAACVPVETTFPDLNTTFNPIPVNEPLSATEYQSFQPSQSGHTTINTPSTPFSSFTPIQEDYTSIPGPDGQSWYPGQQWPVPDMTEKSQSPMFTSSRDGPGFSEPTIATSYKTDISSFNTRRYSLSVARTEATSISHFSTAHNLVMNTNKRLISDNLMRKYHIAFELALACCLSQETCPYQMNIVQQSPGGVSWLVSRFETVNLLRQFDMDKQESGVYYRVAKLDRMAQACNLIRLSKSEDRAVSKALYLSIMAFATQWAQGSTREYRRYPQNVAVGEKSPVDVSDDLGSDFDRTLQNSLWIQAKRALEECSDIECFKVICADWIMGLTQKPIRNEDFGLDDIPSTLGSRNPFCSNRDTISAKLDDIIAADGPPLFVERAARKVHSIKFRYDSRRACALDFDDPDGSRKSISVESIRDDDMATFNLVYWMTIMIDSISSAINGRPLVVSDRDCHHDPVYIGHPKLEQFAIDYQPQDLRWWARLFEHENARSPLHWPCSYDTAIKGIIAATPVKVILFRHVSLLQNTLRSNYKGQVVENVISNAMAIYKHWNVAYGAFVRDLIGSYDTVPLQMQIWFIHIIAYFYYATLLLADLVEVVDKKRLGLEYYSQIRTSVGVVNCLRRDSITIISDLARASISPAAFDISDFHASGINFPVVKGAILPEPWTLMLIRVFTKVSFLQLSEVEETLRYDPTSLETAPTMDTVRRCEDCIKALYYLGRKSDIARAVGVVLFSAIRQYLMLPPEICESPMPEAGGALVDLPV